MGFYRLQNEHYFNENALWTQTLSMTFRGCAKVIIHVWSYDFYDTTFQLNNSNVTFLVPRRNSLAQSSTTDEYVATQFSYFGHMRF